MEVICEHCKTKLNVPDEKIPKDQLVRISCPKCKNKISIDSRKSTLEEAPETDGFGETGKLHLKFIEQKREKAEEGSYGYEDYSDDESLDFFNENVKLALVLSVNPDDSTKIKSSVETLGYKYIESATTRDALGKMRFYHFDLVFLSDGFDGQGLNNSPILNYLNHISMSSRRKIFLALMGEKFKTLDEMMAFALSANAVINTKDADKLSSVLKKGLADHEKFYKVFMDTIIEVGKA
jgi:DNA-directed RNA polymerase subunit RPC12/RpoP